MPVQKHANRQYVPVCIRFLPGMKHVLVAVVQNAKRGGVIRDDDSFRLHQRCVYIYIYLPGSKRTKFNVCKFNRLIRIYRRARVSMRDIRCCLPSVQSVILLVLDIQVKDRGIVVGVGV